MAGGTEESGDRPLAGVRVLVTRPVAQAGPFCTLLQRAGAQVTRFPVMEIREPRNQARLRQLLDALDGFDLAVFVSANAVQRVVPAVLARGPWPGGLRVAAIGARTARELRDRGRPPDIVPGARFDSEALLAEPALQQVTGLRVVIFRGEGGRNHLAATLSARGARVTYAEAYRRALPDLDPEPLLRAWAEGGIDAVTVTSGESLQNLFDMVGDAGRAPLLRTPLVAGGARVAALARETGFTAPIETADDPTDASMYAALLRLRQRLA